MTAVPNTCVRFIYFSFWRVCLKWDGGYLIPICRKGCASDWAGVILFAGSLTINDVMNDCAVGDNFLKDGFLVDSPFCTDLIVSCVLSPSNGISPVNITYAKQPTLHISHCSPYFWPANTYGAQYSGVPHTLCIPSLPIVPNPQSITLILILPLLSDMSMFYGFKSLCAIPKEWVYCSAVISWMRIEAVRVGDKDYWLEIYSNS